MRDNLALAIEKHKTIEFAKVATPRIFTVLRYTTTLGLARFVGRLSFAARACLPGLALAVALLAHCQHTSAPARALRGCGSPPRVIHSGRASFKPCRGLSSCDHPAILIADFLAVGCPSDFVAI